MACRLSELTKNHTEEAARAACAVKYHFVWRVKRRASVLKNDVAHRLKEVLHEVAEEHDWEIN
jgi:putative transposase